MHRLWIAGVICLLVSLSTMSCQKGEEAEVETAEGVPVVHNPIEPVPPEGLLTKISFQEELTIGEAEGRDEYMFSDIVGVTVDDGERIYILDYQQAQVRVFNDRGEYLFEIGKQGQGPLEFSRPRSLCLSPQEQLVIEDYGNNLLKFFTLDGEHVKSLSTATMRFFSRVKIDSQGYITAMTGGYNAKDAWYEVSRFDPDLNLLKVVASITYPFRSDFNPFRAIFTWQIRRDDNIVYGFPETYEIQILSPEGEGLKKITKDYKPIAVTEEEKEEERKKHPPEIKPVFPKFYPPFRTFTLDEKDRIFVQTREKTEEKTGYFYDIFDAEGRYIAKVPLEANPIIWKKGKLYALYEDEKGLQMVKRYKVIWEE